MKETIKFINCQKFVFIMETPIELDTIQVIVLKNLKTEDFF